MTTINEEIKKTVSNVYARAYIKRRSAINGTYENDWVEITSYVKKFGTIQTAVDDIKLNTFKASGINLTVSNSDGKFNREDDANSLWYGYLTRYKTLVRLKGGYTNVDDTVGTTETTLGSNLLTNGDCEAISGWSSEHLSNLTVTSSPKVEGSYSIRATKQYNPAQFYIYQDIAVTPGQHYRWQGYSYLQSSVVSVYDGLSTQTAVYESYTATSGAVWRFYHNSITAQTSTIQFAIAATKLAFGNYYFYVDDCRLQLIQTVTASGVIDNSSQGIFVLTDEIPLSGDKNQCALRCKSLNSIFTETRAADISGITGVHTASEIITTIKNATDGAGTFIFRTFIDGDLWHIQTTTNSYTLNAGSELDNLSCWALMIKLAEAEGYVVYIDRKGEFHFKSREPDTTSSMFSFLGLGYRNMNIKSIPEYYEALNKTYNVVRCKFNTADTSTSYATYGTSTTINASNPSWKYGQRVYDFENIYINTATAESVVQNLYNLYSSPKYNVKIKTKLVPHLNLMDKVSVSYSSSNLVGAALWDIAILDVDYFSNEMGENINFNNDYFTIISKTINLDTFECEFLLDEII